MTKKETVEVSQPLPEKKASAGRASKSRAGFTRGLTGRLIDESKVNRFEEMLVHNRIDIPKPVRNKFLSEGYHVGWVRYFDNSKGAEDLANLYKKIETMGFEFVRPEEVPEMALGFRQADNEIYGTMVTEGDLALAKIPVEDYEAILEVKARKVARVSQGILNPLKGKGIDAVNRSFITKGQRRTEEQEEEALNVLNDKDL